MRLMRARSTSRMCRQEQLYGGCCGQVEENLPGSSVLIALLDWIQTHTRIHTYSHTQAHTNTPTHTNTHAHIRTHTEYTYIQTDTQKRTYTLIYIFIIFI